MLAALCLLIVPLALFAAAYWDLTTMTIPNPLNLGLAAAFVLIGPFFLSWAVYGAHVGAGAAMLVVAMALFAFGWIGGGDAKLFAATSLWLGWDGMLGFVLVTAVAGGALTLALMALRNVPVVPAVALERAWVARLLKPKGEVPYGLALATGGLIMFPHSAIFAAALSF